MTFGEKQKLLEIPCSWYLDDLPPQMFMKSQGNASGWTSPDIIFKLWKDEFDYLYEYEDEGVFPITIHPDVSGRPQGIMMHTKLIEYMRSKPGVTFIKRNPVVISKKRGLLVLDEPTVFLPKSGVDILFSLVRDISSEGISVIFVSHDLDEVMELTDSFTVFCRSNDGGACRCTDRRAGRLHCNKVQYQSVYRDYGHADACCWSCTGHQDGTSLYFVVIVALFMVFV